MLYLCFIYALSMLYTCFIHGFTIDMDAFVIGSPNLQSWSIFKRIGTFQTSISPSPLLQE